MFGLITRAELERIGPQPIVDARHNAPDTLSRLHGENRARILYARAEAERQRYMATYAPRPAADVGELGIPARYRLATYAVCALVGVVFWTAVFAAVLS